MDEAIRLLKDIRDLLTRIEAKLTTTVHIPSIWTKEPPEHSPPWRVGWPVTGDPPPNMGSTTGTVPPPATTVVGVIQ